MQQEMSTATLIDEEGGHRVGYFVRNDRPPRSLVTMATDGLMDDCFGVGRHQMMMPVYDGTCFATSGECVERKSPLRAVIGLGVSLLLNLKPPVPIPPVPTSASTGVTVRFQELAGAGRTADLGAQSCVAAIY